MTRLCHGHGSLFSTITNLPTDDTVPLSMGNPGFLLWLRLRNEEKQENHVVKQQDTPAYLMPPVCELSKVGNVKYRIKTWLVRKAPRLCLRVHKRFHCKRGPRVRLQEALAMDFVARNTTIPVPRVLDVFSIGGTIHILQEFIDGPLLEDVWHRLSPEERRSAILQMKDYLIQLRSLPPPHPECVQAVDGSGLVDPRVARGEWGPFKTHADFHNFLNYDVLSGDPERYPLVQAPLAKVLQKRYRTVFSHGDFGPHNAIWKDGKVVVIDWERAGWFPEYWDFTRAYEARGDMETWWNMFKETVDSYDDEVELACRIGEYFENI